MKKQVLRALSLILIAALFASMLLPVSAARQYHYYVSLGDSITAGAAQAGYKNTDENVWVPGAYPNLVRKALGAVGFQGARAGWRSNELRVILDDSYDGDDYTRNFLPMWGAGQTVESLTESRQRYREQIAKADIITLSFGGNDLLGSMTYATTRIAGWFGEGSQYAAIYEAAAEKLRSGNMNGLASLVEASEQAGFYAAAISEVVAAMTKGAAGFIKNWDTIIRLIRELNPTAEIIALTVYNTPAGEYGELGEKFSQSFIDPINYYITTGSKVRNEYKVADIREIEIGDGHSPDGRHPDFDGHTYIAKTILEVLGEYEKSTDAEATEAAFAFVERLYQVCLGREAEAGELDYYTDLLMNGAKGIETAAKFIFSDEFGMKRLCDRHYVIALYQALMGREPLEDEIDNWVWRLQQGDSREKVFNQFARSAEFSKICSDAGIKPGKAISEKGKGTKPGGYCTVKGCKSHEPVVSFVKRLYTVCLDRNPEKTETDAWHYNLVHGDYTAKTASQYFLFSDEFKQHKYGNKDFVRHLYKAMMDRSPSKNELTYWSDQLSSGMKRSQVFTAFADSDEFKVLCGQYGLICE